MTTVTGSSVSDFVGRLTHARERLGPGGVAGLRRGAGRSVGDPVSAAEAFFSLGPPQSRALEEASWVAATLWARHEVHKRGFGSYGVSLRVLAGKVPSAASRLLVRALSADRDELPAALRRSIGLLSSHGVPIDFDQLIWDISRWDEPARDVQRSWSRDFHVVRASAASAVTTSKTSEG